MLFIYICAKPFSLTKNEGKLVLVPKSSGPLLERLPLNKADRKLRKFGYICRYRKALYSGSLRISLYLELFCFLSFISFVLRKLT